MDYETGRDTIDGVDEQYEDEPNSITVTGKEWWMTEALPWPQEEVDDRSISQVYEYTLWSSLDVSISGEDIDNRAALGECLKSRRMIDGNRR